MSSPSKPRVIKDFDRLDEAIQERIKLEYPRGFHRHLIKFRIPDGREVSALPFETDDRYYMVRMSISEARQIVAEDDDYDEDGILKEDVQSEYEERYEDMEESVDPSELDD